MFNTFFYQPLYNALVFLVDIVPNGDLGLAVIFLTIIVKMILFPLTQKGYRTQFIMKEIEPELKRVREEYKDDREKQGRLMLEIYKKKGINPLSSIFPLLIQLPIIMALYFVFFKGGLPKIDPTLLYSFLPHPEQANALFLGQFDVTQKSLFVAIVAAITQFFQAKLALAPKSNTPTPTTTESSKDDFQATLSKTMSMQMIYIFPIMIFFISLNLSAAVALYFVTSNTVAICQEAYLRRQFRLHKS